MVKKNNTENILEDNQDYFLAIKDERDDFIVYESEGFKLSEIDIINLIKICLIERRSKAIGERILAVYKDSTDHKKDIVNKKLSLIGIHDDEKITTTTNKNTRKK